MILVSSNETGSLYIPRTRFVYLHSWFGWFTPTPERRDIGVLLYVYPVAVKLENGEVRRLLSIPTYSLTCVESRATRKGSEGEEKGGSLARLLVFPSLTQERIREMEQKISRRVVFILQSGKRGMV